MCQHETFETSARIARLTDRQGGPVTGYSADIKIKCAQCGMPFEFIGVPNGRSPSQPMASLDNTELRAPIRPSSDPAAQIQSLINKL